MSRTEREKMLAGELYRPSDPELVAERRANKLWLAAYNEAFARPAEERHALLAARLGSVGARAA